MGSTLTQFASLILRTASAWVDGPCGQVLCHAPGPCTDGSDEPPPWPHQDEMPVAWCSSRLAFRSGVFFCVPLRVFSSPVSCTQRGWVLSRASPRSPSRLLPAALARMQASHGSHCTCATGPCRPAVPLLFLLSASAGGRALSLKAPRSCDPSRRPPSWCDIFPHATAHDVHGVSLHEPFLLLGGAAPSVFSLFFLPLCCCVAFLKKSVALVSRPPLTNPPALMQFLEHTRGGPVPMHLRRRRPPASRVVVAPSTLAMQIQSPSPRTASLPLMRHGLACASFCRGECTAFAFLFWWRSHLSFFSPPSG